MPTICGMLYSINQRKRRMLDLREEIFCPVCAAAGIRRKLMEVDSAAKGVVYPYCKGCKKNVKIELPLRGNARNGRG